jgi:hypothetical protein
MSVLNQIQEECDLSGIPSSKMILILIRIGLSERMQEREKNESNEILATTFKNAVMHQIGEANEESEKENMERMLNAKPVD